MNITTMLHRYSDISLKNVLENHKFAIVSIPKLDIDVIEDLSPLLYPFEYAKSVCEVMNNFIEDDEEPLFTKFSLYTPSLDTDKAIIKLSFIEEESTEFEIEIETVEEIIAALENQLKPSLAAPLNYKTKNDIYIVQPNQKRFWTVETGREDANELINQILCEI